MERNKNIITTAQAIKSLDNSAEFYIRNDEITWVKGEFTQAEIDAEQKRLQTECDAQAYARNRKAEYPDMGTQLNKIYDDGVTKWKSEMVDPVKAKWPKDNSGPVE